MELELHRVDLLQTAAAAPGALRVLPPGEKKTQQVVVGDSTGVVQCFSVKKGEVALAFKTVPGPQKVRGLDALRVRKGHACRQLRVHIFGRARQQELCACSGPTHAP